MFNFIKKLFSLKLDNHSNYIPSDGVNNTSSREYISLEDNVAIKDDALVKEQNITNTTMLCESYSQVIMVNSNTSYLGKSLLGDFNTMNRLKDWKFVSTINPEAWYYLKSNKHGNYYLKRDLIRSPK